MHAVAQHRTYDFIIAWFADVGSALIHGFGPQVVIRQAVRDYNTERRELVMQAPDLIRARSFNIQYQHIGTMPFYGHAHFFVSFRYVYRSKILGKTDRQSLSSSGVIVIDNQVEWFHRSPLSHRGYGVPLAATANCYHRRDRIRARAALLFGYFRNALSVGGSNGSVWSFPFCFNRISTFPSASSNCLRQVAESCMPSSKSVRDFSSGTSPFSSSSTIFSSRSRQSSNFTNPFAPVPIVMPFPRRNVQ